MSFDPLNIRKQPQPQPASQPSNWFGNAVSVALLGFAVFIVGERQGWWQQRESDGGDREEQVEPAPKDKPASIVFIREHKDAPAEQVLLLREVQKLGIDFRDLDDDLPESEKYLSYGLTKGVQPPMVVLQNAANQPYAVQDWPSVEEVKRWKK